MQSFATAPAKFSLPINNYPRMKFLDPTTGRFTSLDPFGGNNHDPQSFNKYGYVHGDPIQGIDPTGKFFATVMVSIAGHFGARLGHATVALAALTDVSLFTLWIRRHDTRNLQDQLPRSGRQIWSNRTRMQVTNSSLTAGEMFERLSQFRDADWVSGTLMRGKPFSKNGERYITFSFDLLTAVGQPEFDVRIQKYDRANRFFSVVTSSGHPLSGFRYFRIKASSDDAHNFEIETAAVDHPTWANDYVKMNLDFFSVDELTQTWVDGFSNLARNSNGTSTLLENQWLGPGSEQEDIKNLVDWRTKN
jgi:RHS repeat-associated protein